MVRKFGFGMINGFKNPLTFKVSSPKNLLEDHTRISELIDSERGGWKAEVVKSVWNATSNGMFSVRSAYMVSR